MKRVLVITFSPLDFDSRVLRQIEALAENFAVTVCHPEKNDRYPWEQVSLYWKAAFRESAGTEPGLLSRAVATIFRMMRNALLLLNFHGIAEKLPYNRYYLARQSLRGHLAEFDLVVANDVETLPLAFALSGKAKVVADLHEFAPGQTAGKTIRNRVWSSYLTWTCRKYLPRCAAVTVVSQAVSDLYWEHFQIVSSVLPSMPKYAAIGPSDVNPRDVKLVHHGMYSPNRGIESLIRATSLLPSHFSLHLVLSAAPRHDLLDLASSLGLTPERFVLYDFVEPEALVLFLNQFDIEVIFIPPFSLNTRAALPNKFFEAIQARLAVVSGPLLEIESRIAEHEIGLTVESFDVSELAKALACVTTEQIFAWKLASSEAASILNWESVKPDYRLFI